MTANVVHLPIVADLPPRPRTRGDCIDGPRPCPWVSCKHHLLPGHMEAKATHMADDSDEALLSVLESMPDTCELDAADRGGATLEEVAQSFSVTREWIRQIEAKTLKRVLPRVKHLRDAIAEEPERVLRPQSGGAARPIEGVRHTAPPAQHAHLPGPGDVTEAAQPFWCPWIGTALSGGLCVKRHQARTRPSAMGGGAAGHSWPTYPQCSRCTDGAAMAARLGAVELVPMRVVLPTEAAPQELTAGDRDDVVAVPVRAIDWTGEGPEEASSPANDTEHTEHTEHTEREEQKDMATTKVKRSDPERVQRMNVGRTTQPAASAGCAFPGCEHPLIPWMAKLPEEFRGFCKTHRTRAQVLRTTLQVSAAEAAARLIAGAGKGTTRARTAARLPETTSPSRCGIEGCPQERAGVRADTRRELAPFCAEHRDAVRNAVRNAHARAGRDWGLAVRRVAALMAAGVDTTNPHAVRAVYEREGLLLGGAPAPSAAPELAPSVQSLRDESDRYFAEARELRAELERVRAQLAAVEQQREDLRRELDALALAQQHAAERIAELEGQQLADAVARPAAAPVQPLPLSRLVALEGAIWSKRGRWTVAPSEDGTRYTAERGDNNAELPYVCASHATAEGALGALVETVEGYMHQRIAELTAALENGRG